MSMDGFGAGFGAGMNAGASNTGQMMANAITEAGYQDRITNIQIELAKATDPGEISQLQALLQQTQAEWQAYQQSANNRTVVGVVIAIAIFVIFGVVAWMMFSRMSMMPI